MSDILDSEISVYVLSVLILARVMTFVILSQPSANMLSLHTSHNSCAGIHCAANLAMSLSSFILPLAMERCTGMRYVVMYECGSELMNSVTGGFVILMMMCTSTLGHCPLSSENIIHQEGTI